MKTYGEVEAQLRSITSALKEGEQQLQAPAVLLQL
jgi:hypothetical protein